METDLEEEDEEWVFNCFLSVRSTEIRRRSMNGYVAYKMPHGPEMRESK